MTILVNTSKYIHVSETKINIREESSCSMTKSLFPNLTLNDNLSLQSRLIRKQDR